MGSPQDWLHLVHVLSAMVWLGGGVILCAIGLSARRSSDVIRVAEFAKTLSGVGLIVVMPSVVLVLITGIAMVATDSEFSFGQLWVRLALGLFAGAFLVGAVYLSRAAIQTDRSAAAGDLAMATAQLGRWITGYAVVLLILVVAVWDMVFKPGT